MKAPRLPPPRAILDKFTPRTWVFVWAAVALALGLYIVLDGWAETDRANRNADIAVEARTAADELCDQIKTYGRRCVVDPQKLPEPAAGPQGERGPAGRDGRGIRNLEAVGGHLWVTYTDGERRDVGLLPRGPRGAVGAAGVPGATGSPGTAGSVGVRGADGVDGVDGRDGIDGKDGVDGAPGPMCPAGYHPATITFKGHQYLVCAAG